MKMPPFGGYSGPPPILLLLYRKLKNIKNEQSMKKLVITYTVFCLFLTSVSTNVSAQEQTFQHQDQVVALGIGLGGNLYSGGYGSGFSRTPAISLTDGNYVQDNPD